LRPITSRSISATPSHLSEPASPAFLPSVVAEDYSLGVSSPAWSSFRSSCDLLLRLCRRLDPPEVVVRVLGLCCVFPLLLLHFSYQVLHLFGFFVSLRLRHELQILLHRLLQEPVLIKVLVIALPLQEQAFQRVGHPLLLLWLLLLLFLL